MYRGTTPTFIFTFPNGFHPSEASKILITFSTPVQNIFEFDEDDVDIIEDTIYVSLTQAQTIKFPDGPVKVQINFVYSGGGRVATDIKTIVWDRNLHNGVIS